MTHLGHALVGFGHLTEATDAYQQSLALRLELGQLHLTAESLAGLARICLIQERPGEAQAFVEEILNFLKIHTLEGTLEPMRVYLTCYRVLVANKDSHSKELLIATHKLLQERAARIENEEMRRSYLGNVAAHREIVQEYAKIG